MADDLETAVTRWRDRLLVWCEAEDQDEEPIIDMVFDILKEMEQSLTVAKDAA